MEQAKTLIRTAVRTFYDTKPVLVVDALLVHSVLNAEELAWLLSSQPKDVRRLITPLEKARIVEKGIRNEAKVGSIRAVGREHYYIPFHTAIDAIKYRVMKLQKRVEDIYKTDQVRKGWRCPRCKSEFETMEILHNMGPEGYNCLKCNFILVETAVGKQVDGGHEKLVKLNTQLKPLQDLITLVDEQRIPENSFFEAFEQKKEIPRGNARQGANQYIPVSRQQQQQRRNVAEQIDASALGINLTSDADQAAKEEAEKEKKRLQQEKNALPSWHVQSVVDQNASIARNDPSARTTDLLKKEESEEKKPNPIEDELAAYMAEMQREKEEAALRLAEEDAESEDVGDDEFEDVSTGVATPLPAADTPASSQQEARNGVKRELDSADGVSSDANSPAPSTSVDTPSDRAAKRVKFENGLDTPSASGALPASGDADDDEEDDFEDV